MVAERMDSSQDQKTITCICGLKITVGPNAKNLGQIIDNHIKEHIKKIKDPQEAMATSEQIDEHIHGQLCKIFQVAK